MSRFKFFQRVDQGDVMSRGYGACYFDIFRHQYVTCPMPFNFLVGWARNLWMATYFHLLQGPKPLADRYNAGYHDGYQEGVEALVDRQQADHEIAIRMAYEHGRQEGLREAYQLVQKGLQQ